MEGTQKAAPDWRDPVYDPTETSITPAGPDLPEPPVHEEPDPVPVQPLPYPER